MTDHDAIDTLLAQLVAAYESDDREIAAHAYAEVEHVLAAHLAQEEQWLFPELARIEPEEANRLREDHRQIRARLEELGIGVDLHATRIGAIRELVQMLRAHVARETAVLYPWADRTLADLAPKNLVELAVRSVLRFADRPLFGERIDGAWRWITYAAWQVQVDQLRAGLAQLGVKPGDRVGIVSRNSTAWATAAYATYSLGATFVPMYEAQRPEEWEFIIRDCGASVVLGRSQPIVSALEEIRARLPALREVVWIEGPEHNPHAMLSVMARGARRPVSAHRPQPDDIAGLVYTSGTTGQPKGAMLSHANLTTNALATVAEFPITCDDRTLSFLPWAHVYGQVVELHILIAAGASTAFNIDTAQLAADLKVVKPTILVAVPRIFNQMHANIRAQIAARPRPIRALFERGHAASVRARRGERLTMRERVLLWFAGLLFGAIRRKLGGRLRYAISASATLSRDVADFIDGLGIAVYEGYGLTETSPVVAMNRPGRRKLGSVGLPIQDVRIVIDQTRGLAPGEGEIVVYGPNVMKGYHARPEETARAFTADGGLRTGDLGRIDDDGFLYITGRIKEQYKLENGKYVMPSPLEERLALSPFIKHVMLHGADHAYNVALVVVDKAQLAAWATEQDLVIRDVTTDERVHALIGAELARQATELRSFERPRDFVITTVPFTIENGLLTPTLKVKRREVLARYGAALEALYAPAQEAVMPWQRAQAQAGHLTRAMP